MTWLSIFS